MRIVRLYSPSGDPDRIRAALEDGEELSVDAQIVAEFGLYAGMELEDGELEALRKAVSARRSKKRALRMIGARAMSRREVTDRLTRRGGSRQEAEETAGWLERIGALDDREYAGMIVRHYSARGFGPAKVKNELFRRGIEKELWPEALEQLPDEEEAIGRLLAGRLGPESGPGDVKKTMDFLLRRGFGYEKVRAALRQWTDTGDFEG